ncbi:unnamed protein product, partial [Allacma fusca]
MGLFWICLVLQFSLVVVQSGKNASESSLPKDGDQNKLRRYFHSLGRGSEEHKRDLPMMKGPCSMYSTTTTASPVICPLSAPPGTHGMPLQQLVGSLQNQLIPGGGPLQVGPNAFPEKPIPGGLPVGPAGFPGGIPVENLFGPPQQPGFGPYGPGPYGPGPYGPGPLGGEFPEGPIISTSVPGEQVVAPTGKPENISVGLAPFPPGRPTFGSGSPLGFVMQHPTGLVPGKPGGPGEQFPGGGPGQFPGGGPGQFPGGGPGQFPGGGPGQFPGGGPGQFPGGGPGQFPGGGPGQFPGGGPGQFPGGGPGQFPGGGPGQFPQGGPGQFPGGGPGQFPQGGPVPGRPLPGGPGGPLPGGGLGEPFPGGPLPSGVPGGQFPQNFPTGVYPNVGPAPFPPGRPPFGPGSALGFTTPNPQFGGGLPIPGGSPSRFPPPRPSPPFGGPNYPQSPPGIYWPGPYTGPPNAQALANANANAQAMGGPGGPGGTLVIPGGAAGAPASAHATANANAQAAGAPGTPGQTIIIPGSPAGAPASAHATANANAQAAGAPGTPGQTIVIPGSPAGAPASAHATANANAQAAGAPGTPGQTIVIPGSPAGAPASAHATANANAQAAGAPGTPGQTIIIPGSPAGAPASAHAQANANAQAAGAPGTPGQIIRLPGGPAGAPATATAQANANALAGGGPPPGNFGPYIGQPGPSSPIGPPPFGPSNIPFNKYSQPYVPKGFSLANPFAVLPTQHCPLGPLRDRQSCQTMELLDSLELGIIADLVRRSGLESLLQQTSDYTFFAPVDQAFLRLPNWFFAMLHQDMNLLQSFVLQHLVKKEIPLNLIQNEFQVLNARPGGNRLHLNIYHVPNAY